MDNITLNQVQTEKNYDLKRVYEDTFEEEYDDSPFQFSNNCKYFEPHQFLNNVDTLNRNTFFHLNCRGLSANWESFRDLLGDIHGKTFSFDIIGISEVFSCDRDKRISLPGYRDIITRCRPNGTRGGVALFIKENIPFKIRDDLSVFIPHIFESLFVEINSQNGKSIIGIIYRPNTAPKADLDIFTNTLNDILDIINTERKHSIIMGDMNIDLLKIDVHQKTNDYLESLFSYGFSPTITLPTRLTCNSATLIDHIYTNRTTSTKSGIIITDVADHFGIFHISSENKSSISNKRDTKRLVRYFSNANYEHFRNLLENTNFDNVLLAKCPNEAYNIFIKLYMISFVKSFPLRISKTNKRYIKKEPWMTSGLLTSSRTKARLFTKKINKPTPQNIDIYKTYNNTFSRLKRLAKIKYYNTILEDNKFNIKKTWLILKEAIGKKNDKTSLPQEFLINNIPTSDKSKIADSFNEYFSNIGPETCNNVPTSPNDYTDFMPSSLSKSMFLDPIDIYSVLDVTKKLKSKNSSGHDEISTKLLKESIHQISIPLTHIINQSFLTGIVPQQMKIAKVVPIFKTSDPTLLTNYRPISLLTTFSKLIERLMYNKVMNFLTENNILYKHQYGFRPKHSTIHPIIHLLNHIAESNNKKKKELTLTLFCDLSKAFDVINHKILLHKLNVYGLRGTINKWFENYLVDRSQYVNIDGNVSLSRKLDCGVPQGSILGPLLYLLYVNDIYKSCNGNILSFADDTTMYVSDHDVNTLYKKAQIETNNLFNWFCANKLSLNPGKTKYIVLRPQHRQCDLNKYTLLVNGSPLNRIGKNCKETSIKFLGIYIDESLSWKPHISHVNSKISRALFSIKQLKNTFPSSSLLTLYFALIHPHIMYGNLAWGNALPVLLKKTELLQKRAVRIINKRSYNSHTEPLFASSKILKLRDLYEYHVNLFMYDFSNKLLPNSFHSLFRYNYEIQIRPTRQSHLLHITKCMSKFSANLPLFAFPKIYNKIISQKSTLVSRRLFKEQCQRSLFNNYQAVVHCSNIYCRECRE